MIQWRFIMPETGNMVPPASPSTVVTTASALTLLATIGVAIIVPTVTMLASVSAALLPILDASIAAGIWPTIYPGKYEPRRTAGGGGARQAPDAQGEKGGRGRRRCAQPRCASEYP